MNMTPELLQLAARTAIGALSRGRETTLFLSDAESADMIVEKLREMIAASLPNTAFRADCTPGQVEGSVRLHIYPITTPT